MDRVYRMIIIAFDTYPQKLAFLYSYPVHGSIGALVHRERGSRQVTVWQIWKKQREICIKNST